MLAIIILFSVGCCSNVSFWLSPFSLIYLLTVVFSQTSFYFQQVNHIRISFLSPCNFFPFWKKQRPPIPALSSDVFLLIFPALPAANLEHHFHILFSRCSLCGPLGLFLYSLTFLQHLPPLIPFSKNAQFMLSSAAHMLEMLNSLSQVTTNEKQNTPHSCVFRKHLVMPQEGCYLIAEVIEYSLENICLPWLFFSHWKIIVLRLSLHEIEYSLFNSVTHLKDYNLQKSLFGPTDW